MCGIYGNIGFGTEERCIESLELLKHRGPDNTGVWINKNRTVFIGHTRLSIIDLCEESNQPMVSEERNLIITFNGEIYNYKSIRDELIALGHKFETGSDTEVLLKGYAQWQEKVLDRLNGMFAFAIWNEKEQTLFAARDRMGQKPFFYTASSNGIAFASEIKSLKHTTDNCHLNFSALSEYLHYGYALAPNTFYNNIFQLEPAHYLIWKNNHLTKIQYWNLAEKVESQVGCRNGMDLQEEFLELLDDSFNLRLQADVPVGAFLSGGLDSSTVVSCIENNNNVNDLKTFSIGFHEDAFSELNYSQMVADHLGTDHFTKTVENNLQSVHSNLRDVFDQPFADTSSIPMLELAALTKKYVTVALSGDGADELLGGYETYKADILFNRYKCLPLFIKKAIHNLAMMLPSSHKKIDTIYKLKQFSGAYDLSEQQAHSWWRQLFPDHEIREMMNPDYLKDMEDYNPFDKIEALYNECSHASPLNQNMYVDIKTWLVDDILVKVDRTSMAHSLEVRNPFLDHRIVEFCMNLPVNKKVNSRDGKIFLKQCVSDKLPKVILKRRKSGFNAPIANWLSSETKLDSNLISSSFFRHKLEEHLTKKQDNSYKLFALLQLHEFQPF